MPDSGLEIVGVESLTSIDFYDKFYVNLLFDHSIYRLMCTHMGSGTKLLRYSGCLVIKLLSHWVTMGCRVKQHLAHLQNIVHLSRGPNIKEIFLCSMSTNFASSVSWKTEV